MTLQHVIITSIIIVLIMSFSHQSIQLCLCKMSDLPGMGWEYMLSIQKQNIELFGQAKHSQSSLWRISAV